MNNKEKNQLPNSENLLYLKPGTNSLFFSYKWGLSDLEKE